MVIHDTIYKILESLTTIVPLLVAIAFFTLAERKVMGSIQRRRGPNVVGFWGILQPFADGLKLILKEILVPKKSNFILFIMSAVIIFFLSFLGWAIIPFNVNTVIADIDLGILFLFAISSLGVYGIILAGWSSNSKYAFLGALRSSAQMISYEVSIGLIIIPVIIFANSLNFQEIVIAQKESWYLIPLLPSFFLFYISAVAETNRAPFDLPEAEAEIVAGYNIEYSGILFALFFLGEYNSIFIMAVIITIFFLGGWYMLFSLNNFLLDEIWFFSKVIFICWTFIFIRANFPRYRYDQLMDIGWKVFLPLSLGYLILVVSFIVYSKGYYSIWGHLEEFREYTTFQNKLTIFDSNLVNIFDENAQEFSLNNILKFLVKNEK